MSAYIKFWLAKELAGVLIFLMILAIPVSLFLLAVFADWIQKFIPKRKRAGEDSQP